MDLNYDTDELLRSRMQEAQGYWSRQYENIVEDLTFASGNQWSEQARKARSGKPVLTMNFVNNYINKIVNPIRKNPFGVNVKHSEKQINHLFQGLVREIEYQSNASEAYETALENAVISGMGFIILDTDYEDDTSLNQTIKICRVSDPTSVYIDPNSEKIDGSDAEYAMRVKYIDKKKAAKLYDIREDELSGTGSVDIFRSLMTPDGSVPEVIYYSKEYKKVKRTWLQDGSYFDGESEFPVSPEMIAGERTIEQAYVKVCKYIGSNKVSETKLDTQYIPVVPVYGDRVIDDSWKGWSGIVKLLRNPQEMVNYYASAEAQAVQSAPTAPWLLAEGQIEGYEDIWATANTGQHDHLPYRTMSLNGQQVPPPQRVPSGAETGHLTQARLSAIEDMQRTTGIFDSQVGREDIAGQSGRAILLKRQNADITTYHYIDNLMKSITQVGRIMLQLINSLYDTSRKLNVRGENGETVQIEGNIQEMGIDSSKFDTEVEAGPMIQNEKEMTNAMLLEIGQLMPEKFGMLADIIIENLNTPGSEEAVERLKKMLPPELLPEDENAEAPDPMAMQALQQAEQTINEQQQMMDQYETVIEQLQQVIISGEQDRQNKIQVEEIKSQTSLAETEMNNATKVEVERIKAGSNAESQIRKIAADAEAQIRKLVLDMEAKSADAIQQVEVIGVDADEAMQMIPKVGGPVGGESEEAYDLGEQAEESVESIDDLLE